MRRPLLLVPFGLLLASLFGLLGGATHAAPEPAAIPSAVKSDYLLFAHLNVKDIRDGALFKEVKQALAKAGGGTRWESVEKEIGREIGIKPSDLDTVTVCVTEVPKRGNDKFILIFTSSKVVDKAAVFGVGKVKPDGRGFYVNPHLDGHVHFPDDKTAVLVHPDLAQKYLDGFAKDRAAWPFTAELAKAAAGHNAFITARPDLLPSDLRTARDVREFGPLFAARAATLTIDLKGKELTAAARATFPDATAAGKARHKAHALIGLISDEVDSVLGGKTDLGAVRPAVKEAERALAAARIEQDGADLTAAVSYKADFDFGVMMLEAVKRARAAAERTRAINNLKQIALALHSYASAHNDAMPVHAIDARGLPHSDPDEKPLLSWRVGLLPYIEQDALYKQFKLDEPWDSANNKKLIEKMPKVYASVVKPGKAGYTHMQMVFGPPAMGYNANLKSTFLDGTSNTIAVVEAAEPVIWTKPDDVMFPEKELPKGFRKKFGGQFPGGFHAAMWDGSVRFVANTVSDRTLGHALTPSGGEVLGEDW